MPESARPVVTGIGTAVHGLSGAAELLGARGHGIAFDATTALSGRDMRNKDRGSRLAIRAVEAALSDAGLLDESGYAGSPDTTAVIVSSNLGNLGSVCELTDTITAETAIGLNPLRLPETACSVMAAWVAIRFGLRGPNLTICNGTTSGLDALFWARTMIAAGRAHTVVVVGVEPTNDAVRTLLGADSVDGAAALVLEPAEAAADRGLHDRVATVAAYGHAPDTAAAIRATGLRENQDVPLWLTERPEHGQGRVLSIEQRLGRCSGALGVLQCAAAAAYLNSGGSGPVLAIAGGADEPASAVVLDTEHSVPHRKGHRHAGQ
jgi:3-oxoacyl-[acyl-carrier-protein] synthase II